MSVDSLSSSWLMECTSSPKNVTSVHSKSHEKKRTLQTIAQKEGLWLRMSNNYYFITIATLWFWKGFPPTHTHTHLAPKKRQKTVATEVILESIHD